MLDAKRVVGVRRQRHRRKGPYWRRGAGLRTLLRLEDSMYLCFFSFFLFFFFLFCFVFFFSSRRRHTRLVRDWSSDVCSSDLKHCTTSAAAVAFNRAFAFGAPPHYHKTGTSQPPSPSKCDRGRYAIEAYGV